jgi:hypothetical protein
VTAPVRALRFAIGREFLAHPDFDSAKKRANLCQARPVLAGCLGLAAASRPYSNAFAPQQPFAIARSWQLAASSSEALYI